MIISPLRASTGRPSRLMVTTSSWSAMSASVRRERAGAVLDVDEELVAEQADGRHDRAGDGRPERADGGLLRRPGEPGGDVVEHVDQQVEVGLAALAGLDAVHDLLGPAAAFTARRALTARLAVEELAEAPGRPHDARRVVHGHDRAGAEHGAGLADLLLAQRHVDLVGREPVGGGTARDERLQFAVAADAARVDRRVQQVAEGGLAELHLVVAGTL